MTVRRLVLALVIAIGFDDAGGCTLATSLKEGRTTSRRSSRRWVSTLAQLTELLLPLNLRQGKKGQCGLMLSSPLGILVGMQ